MGHAQVNDSLSWTEGSVTPSGSVISVITNSAVNFTTRFLVCIEMFAVDAQAQARVLTVSLSIVGHDGWTR